MKKISFDFDGTVGETHIKMLAKILVAGGADVWILTSRMSEKTDPSFKARNWEVWEVCEYIGIPNEKVIFTEGDYKWKAYAEHKFDLHFDNMEDEVEEIVARGGKALLVCDEWMEIKSRVVMEAMHSASSNPEKEL